MDNWPFAGSVMHSLNFINDDDDEMLALNKCRSTDTVIFDPLL